MKKLLSVLLASILLIGCVMTLASCGGLSGKYEREDFGVETSYTFRGKNVTVALELWGTTVTLNGTYELGEDDLGNKTITITFEDNSSEEAKEYGGTLVFAEGVEDGEKYVSIGGVRYFLDD